VQRRRDQPDDRPGAKPVVEVFRPAALWYPGSALNSHRYVT